MAMGDPPPSNPLPAIPDARALQRIVDALDVGVVVMDARTEIQYANARALDLLGLTEDEMLGRLVLHYSWDVVHEDGSPFPPEDFPLGETLRSGKPGGPVVMGVKRPRHEERAWILVRVEPVFVEGRLQQAVATFTDIGSLHAAERRHKEALADAERFRAALDEVPAYVYIKDRQSRYVYGNAPTLRLFKCTAAELRGSPDDRFFPPEVVERLREVDSRVLGGERTHEIIEVASPGGPRSYLEVKTPLAPDPETGEVPGLLGISIDISDRQHHEEVVRKSQRLEAIGRLAGGVAHDFNNMLSVILGHTELALAETAPDAATRENLEEIHASARRSADLTRQLLAFSRRQPSAPVAMHLGAHVSAASKLLRRLLSEDIALVVETSDDAAKVRLDPAQLDQLLANLCVNAADAIHAARLLPGHEAGGDCVRIRVAPLRLAEGELRGHGTRSGPFVRLSVSDTGVGITPEVRERMFEPFFTTKPAGQGTGLGLSTVFGVVAQAEGFISVDSELQRGSTFHLHFPQLPAGDGEEVSAPAPEPLAGSGETILVVEDDARVMQTTLRALGALGYRVLSAADGSSALQMLEASARGVDLVLTDVMMPGMNGRELAHAVRARLPGQRVLFMSGYTADILSAGDDPIDESNLLAKPFTIAQLAARVREALRA